MVEDRRTRHTKERIRKAMITCLNTTSLDKITVMQICETADINRSTFYAHYDNPIVMYNLLEQSMTSKMNKQFEDFKNKTVSYKELLYVFLSYCYENSELFLVLYKTDSVSFKNAVLELTERYDFLANVAPEEEKAYIFDFYVNGVFSMIARWLREEPNKSIEEMVELTYRLTHKSARAKMRPVTK